MSQNIESNKQHGAQSHVDENELALWQALKKISATTASVMRSEIGPGVSGADFSILSRIEELGNEGEVLAQSDLLKSLGWDKSRLSHHLTRMQERSRKIHRTRVETVLSRNHHMTVGLGTRMILLKHVSC